MKNTLLATTALVSMAGAASAELTISGTGRLGLVTTEGSVAKAAKTTFGKITTAADALIVTLGAAITTGTLAAHSYNTGTVAITIGTIGADAIAGEITSIDNLILEAQARLAGGTNADLTVETEDAEALSNTAAKRKQIATDIASLQAVRARLVTATDAVAAVADSTDAANRFRIAFTGTGETDSGIAYGISGRAEQSDSTLAGSQYISGAFGKISMGDLGGAAKDAVGNVAGVGLTSLSSHHEVAFQADQHNVGYQFSTAGLTFGMSQNTAVKTGSNSAMGLSYSGDMGGTAVSVGVGQSKVGTSTQSSMSISGISGGLTVKAVSTSNDNGPAVVAANGTNRSGTGTTAFVIDTLAAANNDTDTTALSISYAMDAMTVTAFTKTVSTAGVADMDYSGFGFGYDMGGVTLKAGVVDANDTQLVDFGVSFSF
jgi:outer membrane protein OmpU